jgi:Rrf2 family protein
MLSKASKYAITAVLYLTNSASKQNKIGAKQIAHILDIPAPFLAKTMQELTKKDIISSVKGPNGGFYLSENNKKKTFFDIIDSIDNVAKFDRCYLGQFECNEENPCVVHHLYAPFKEKLIKKLKTKTILEMSDEYAHNNNLAQLLD